MLKLRAVSVAGESLQLCGFELGGSGALRPRLPAKSIMDGFTARAKVQKSKPGERKVRKLVILSAKLNGNFIYQK